MVAFSYDQKKTRTVMFRAAIRWHGTLVPPAVCLTSSGCGLVCESIYTYASELLDWYESHQVQDVTYATNMTQQILNDGWHCDMAWRCVIKLIQSVIIQLSRRKKMHAFPFAEGQYRHVVKNSFMVVKTLTSVS